MPLEMNIANQYVDHTEQQSAAPGWSRLSDVHDAFAPVFGNSYFAKSCLASSASTPPVMVIGENGALAATSALGIMI